MAVAPMWRRWLLAGRFSQYDRHDPTGATPMTDPTASPSTCSRTIASSSWWRRCPASAPEDISIDVTDDGHLTLRAAMHGEGQERIDYLVARVVVRTVRAHDRAAVRRRRPARQRHVRQRGRVGHVPQGGGHRGGAAARPAHRPRARRDGRPSRQRGVATTTTRPPTTGAAPPLWCDPLLPPARQGRLAARRR